MNNIVRITNMKLVEKLRFNSLIGQVIETYNGVIRVITDSDELVICKRTDVSLLRNDVKEVAIA